MATGAPADRGRIAGAGEHALFPCELDDSRTLADRIATGEPAAVTFVLAGERVGRGWSTRPGSLAARTSEAGHRDDRARGW